MTARPRTPRGTGERSAAEGLLRLRQAVRELSNALVPAPAVGGGPSLLVLRSGAARTGSAVARTAAPQDGRPPAVPVPRSEPEPGQAVEEPDADALSAWQLVQQAQAGDADAFGQLYDRYVDQVFRYVYYRVGSRSVAEDLCSETFLRALRRIGSFTWRGRDVGAWFVTIARNLIADHYKSSRYRLEVTTGDLLGDDEGDTVAAGPEQLVLEQITHRTLLAAVTRLGPEQQECIVLRFLQGLSVSETAQVMGKNEGAIKALQYRAVKALGRMLPDAQTLDGAL